VALAPLIEVAREYQAAWRPSSALVECFRELQAALLAGLTGNIKLHGTLEPRFVPKLHCFFSQGRAIVSCLTSEGPHLNDRGDVTCPFCAQKEKKIPTLPLHFCRACGQEYYGVSVDEDGAVFPRELEALEIEGMPVYLYPLVYDEAENPLPDHWMTPKGNLKKNYQQAFPENCTYCPLCNRLFHPAFKTGGQECGHQERLPVAMVPAPFLFCPSCGISYDKRPKEFSKLFTFGTVGRSTGTDVILSSTLRSLPKGENKIIAFSTALR